MRASPSETTVWSTTRIAGRNMCLSAIANGSPRPEPSVGSKGDSYDNALAETINGLDIAELLHRRAPWTTKESLELATLEWVSWFNHQRLLEPIGYIPPAEAEANYYRQPASKPPWWRPDLNQPASTIPGAIHSCR